MCTPDLMHAMGMQHPSDTSSAQQIGGPVTNPLQPQQTQVAVPANTKQVGSVHDIYAYNVPGPGQQATQGMGPNVQGASTRPQAAVPTAAPTPPNPLDPLQQANRRANLAQAMRPYTASVIT